MKGKLYHIKLKTSSNINEGYIGVTERSIDTRFSEHELANSRVGKSIRKYKNLIEVIELNSGNIDEMYALEEQLRPEDNIGWNIVKGGGKPPRTTSESSKKGYVTRLETGFYKSDKFKEGIEKTISTLRDSGYYESDQFSKQQSSRATKGELLRRDSGYYESESFKEKRVKGGKTRRSKHPTFNLPVDQFDLEDKFLQSFASIYEVYDTLGFMCTPIDLCCKGKKLTHKQFKWKYRTFND
jgi:hypothetical protein